MTTEWNKSEATLIYERSQPGRVGAQLEAPRLSDTERAALIPERFRRAEPPALPEVTEGELMRHYVDLASKNFHIDKGFYPLGSCTMKYNPKRNDAAAAHPGFAESHPLAPDSVSQGSLRLMWELEEILKEITGFDAVTLQPVAGAHGELVGALVMKAYHDHTGAPRHKMLIPDSAHGTNPASVVMSGLTPVEVKSNDRGLMSVEAVRAALDDDTVGIMLTNPNTLGLFESEILGIVEAVREAGALLYMDGANLNAQLGIVKPGKIGFDLLHMNLHKTFSTPHGGGGPGAGALGVSSRLEPFLPAPTLARRTAGADGPEFYLDYDRPLSIGRVHSCYGNFANSVRAYAYIRTLGERGLRRVSENAIINANYLRVLLRDTYQVAFPGHCQHEVVLSAERQKKAGGRAGDISKRLLDYGFHSPTTYFPLIVREALMIEPTETESRQTLEEFAAVMKRISREIEESPELVTSAPHSTPVRRLNEAKAARELDVCYTG
ncbi:MAG TPA: aminomethyl-transferring glycine dehydrogenase subunit GcvPB [candidate division Zixibacteria bacterium]|nr:aminomethyl-transferring glycine dehydrogenase subunit GcvPB [candidate division Zixibacteria bacterium]